MAKIFLKAVSPGRAELHITPWEGGPDGVELSIQRSEGAPHLDPVAREWVGDKHWIQLQGACVQGQDLVMPVGQNIVDPLLAGTQGPRCRAFVRIAGGDEVQHAFRIEPDVLPSSAAGSAPPVGVTSQISAPVPIAEPVTASVPEVVAPPVKKRSMWPIFIGVAVLLLIAAVAAYFLLFRPAEPIETSKPVAAAIAPGCTVNRLAGADTLAFVQACIRDVKDPAVLLGVIRAARDAGKCEIAQRLYANRATAGDIAIAMAYAREYDPASRQDACFKPDAATAKYWYDSVLEKDPKNPEAQAALQALPK